MRRRRFLSTGQFRVTLMTGLLVPALATLPCALASAPTEPACLPLVAGSTGVLVVGPQIPSQQQLSGQPGGFGPLPPVEIARTLPDVILFKTNHETFSSEYSFVVRAGRMYVRPAVGGRGTTGQPWHRLDLPACLDGHIQQVSADGRFLIVIGAGRQVYSHDMPGGDLSPSRWTWRWGPYFWTGTGMQMLPDVRSFSASELTTAARFTDSSGQERTPLGVGTVYLLRGDRRTITYLDPWLPADESREVCGPDEGRRRLAGLSASSSTLLVIDELGTIWTRLYDFDISGANTVLGNYSWQQGRPTTDTRWQLPAPQWVRHSPPPGRVTDRVSIATTGLSSSDRLLRVEGLDDNGVTGLWEKTISARRWTFHPLGNPLVGGLLPRAQAPATPDAVGVFEGAVDGARVTVKDLRPGCSPAHLQVTFGPGVALTLLLHLTDGLRQDTRARGLDDTPREYAGALEIPVATFTQLSTADPRIQAWVSAHLGNQRITTAPVALTSTRLRMLDQCWEITLDGRPARTDTVRIPPDTGIVVGRTTRDLKDASPPVVCR